MVARELETENEVVTRFWNFEVRRVPGADTYQGVLNDGWNDFFRATREFRPEQFRAFLRKLPEGSTLFVVHSAQETAESGINTDRLLQSEAELMKFLDQNMPVVIRPRGTQAEIEQLIGPLPLAAKVVE